MKQKNIYISQNQPVDAATIETHTQKKMSHKSEFTRMHRHIDTHLTDINEIIESNKIKLKMQNEFPFSKWARDKVTPTKHSQR